MESKLPSWSPACGHKLPALTSAGGKTSSLDEIVELHYCISPQLRQISQCNRCFYDLSAVEIALSILDRSMSMLETVQTNYSSARTTETTARPSQQHQYTLAPSMPMPGTQITANLFTIGEYTLRGEENNLVAKHVVNCIVSDISEQVEDLRRRMDKIWESEFQMQSHSSRQRVDTHRRIDQLIDDLLTRAWAAVGRGKLGL